MMRPLLSQVVDSVEGQSQPKRFSHLTRSVTLPVAGGNALERAPEHASTCHPFRRCREAHLTNAGRAYAPVRAWFSDLADSEDFVDRP